MRNAPLWWTIAAIWAAIFAGGATALRQLQVPLNFVICAAMVAGAIEASFYAATGFAAARDWVRGLPRKSWWIAASTLPSYLIYTRATGTFNWRAFVLLIVLASVAAWWYEVLPRGLATDSGFLLLMACGLLLGLFPFLYPPLSKQLRTEYIGHIMWLRLSYWVVLAIRNKGDMGFGFIPLRRDWLIGARCVAYCVPVAAVVLWLVQPMRFKDNLAWSKTTLVVIGTFVGILWVVALSEELFFRGMLQPAFSKLVSNAWVGLVVTSVAFGMVHLSFGGKFPNWRMVLLAGVLGLFCGRAAQLAGSIRAGMVTHAVVVTLYRVFLTPK